MKTKKIFILAIILIGAYYFWKYKGKISLCFKSPVAPPVDFNSINSSDLITSIVDKNKVFIKDLMQGAGKSFEEMDLTWFENKSKEDLATLYNMSTEDFKAYFSTLYLAN